MGIRNFSDNEKKLNNYVKHIDQFTWIIFNLLKIISYYFKSKWILKSNNLPELKRKNHKY